MTISHSPMPEPDAEMIERARNPARGPDGRLLSLRDAVEMSIYRPRACPARGAHRDELVRRRDEACTALADADGELGVLLDRRRELVDRIIACNLAISGTSQIRDWNTGEPLQTMRDWSRRIPFDDPQPEVDEREVSVVSGVRLRAAILDLLRAVRGPMSPREIERLLRLQGLLPAGRPSQTIVNALRPALRRGQVVALDRGWYEIAA